MGSTSLLQTVPPKETNYPFPTMLGVYFSLKRTRNTSSPREFSRSSKCSKQVFYTSNSRYDMSSSASIQNIDPLWTVVWWFCSLVKQSIIYFFYNHFTNKTCSHCSGVMKQAWHHSRSSLSEWLLLSFSFVRLDLASVTTLLMNLTPVYI